jgi:predicted HAD superfamily Cof-like phosphohydrolase
MSQANDNKNENPRDEMFAAIQLRFDMITKALLTPINTTTNKKYFTDLDTRIDMISGLVSRKTNFEKVVDFNTQFGVLTDTELVPKLNIIAEDPNQVEFCLKLIREEVAELETAVKENNYVEVVDALTDILYVVYGMGCRIGVDMDKAFALVHENNMSKLCATEEEAQRSIAFYGEQNIPAAYRRAPNGADFVVFNRDTKKILKRCEYVPVDLSPLF